MAKEKKVEQITNLEDDFAQWYTDICRKAELVEYASVKGFTILRPYGYAIWENIQRIMDGMFKKTGHVNVAMPVLIPESLLKKEGELVEGFAPEVAWVTMGGEEKLEERKATIHAAALEAKLAAEAIDVTIPGKEFSIGHQHPMNQVLQQIKDTFVGMGYQVVEGPEVELADYNFTRLNIEEGHPSRDRSDTFYFTDDDSVLLRTQTSPMQIRVMENAKPPICILAPGRVFRKDEADATHSPMFHQIEGLVVDENITMGDLKGALISILQKVYGESAATRFRPHHFPFTEPSCEMDMQCHKCHGVGEIDGQVCSTCHGEGWIELLGAGMVHPTVLENCGIDPEKYSGFAFGMGLERMAMGRMKINDLRLIFDNDVRFLNQF